MAKKLAGLVVLMALITAGCGPSTRKAELVVEANHGKLVSSDPQLYMVRGSKRSVLHNNPIPYDYEVIRSKTVTTAGTFFVVGTVMEPEGTKTYTWNILGTPDHFLIVGDSRYPIVR